MKKYVEYNIDRLKTSRYAVIISGADPSFQSSSIGLEGVPGKRCTYIRGALKVPPQTPVFKV
jgi:hypothetical protein